MEKGGGKEGGDDEMENRIREVDRGERPEDRLDGSQGLPLPWLLCTPTSHSPLQSSGSLWAVLCAGRWACLRGKGRVLTRSLKS